MQEEIVYENQKIPYTLIKTKIKNMYIHIKKGEVTVKIPNRMPEREAKAIVKKKAKWIYQKVKEQELKENQKKEEITVEQLGKLQQVVDESVVIYSKKLGIIPNKIKIKKLQYAWGSCSPRNNITINLELANKPEQVIRYVVLHEMCHLKEKNHSRKFWDLVKKEMIDYEIYRKELRKN